MAKNIHYTVVLFLTTQMSNGEIIKWTVVNFLNEK